jgi:predicted outer membrane repeat protein
MERAFAFAVLFLSTLAAAAPAAARTWRVAPDGTGDAPTIQAAVDSARTGDLVLAAPGRYTWTNQGTGDEYALIRFLRGATGFTVRAEAGPELTIVDAERLGRVIYIQGGDDNRVTIEGFTITGGQAPLFGDFCGGGLLAHLSSPVFRNCVFAGNAAERGGGIYYAGVSGPRFESCVFRGNRAARGAAIFLVNSSLTPVFSKCVIRDNVATDKGGAIYAYHFGLSLEGCAVYDNDGGTKGGALYGERLYPSTVTGCTIAGNRADEGSALYLFSSEAQTLSRTIIAGNGGGPPLVADQSPLRAGCCDLFGNAASDEWPAGTVDLGDNISLDPAFCGDLSPVKLSLRSDSPCLLDNQPDDMSCGLIGAFEADCGAAGVERATWGSIKRLYR